MTKPVETLATLYSRISRGYRLHRRLTPKYNVPSQVVDFVAEKYYGLRSVIASRTRR